MDSTTSPPTLDSLAATLSNATIDKAERNEFSNSARDMFKFVTNNYYNFTKEGENLVLESSDVYDYLRNAVPLLLAEIHKNDLSRSVRETTSDTDISDPISRSQTVTTDHTPHSSVLESDPVHVVDIVPPESSLLPVTSIAARYTRSMLKCLAGYPLYDPKPFSELSKGYLLNGVNVGDVGFVRANGTFDFLFNICPSKNGLINPPNLPDGFSLETSDHSATRDLEPLPRHTCHFQSPITKTRSGEYICEGTEGAVLELPEGAVEEEATNIRPFATLAARHGVQWYEYTMQRGRDISNGSLYLITSFTKCTQWGTAVFDRPCASGQGLRFDRKSLFRFGKSTSKYRWKGSSAFPTKVSNLNQGNTPNQCVFLRGYKIMIRQDIFDNLCNIKPLGSDSVEPSSSSQAGSSSQTRQRAQRIRGGGGTDPISKILTGGGLLSRASTVSTVKSDEVVLHPNFNSSLVHPSDLINATLLTQNPDAKIVITHDAVWCNLLRDNFPELNYATLINIARSYTSTVDEYGCVFLEKMSNSSIFLNETTRLLRGTGTSTFQGAIQPECRTITDKDRGPVPVRTPIPLPYEVVERILLSLDIESMLACRLVNRKFNEIIQSSTLLQYSLTCRAAGVIDNPRSPLSYTERLEVLKKREEAWRKLKPVFETTIKIDHRRSGMYDLAAGTYLFGEHNRKDMYYCRLPSSLQEIPQWIRIPSDGLAQSWSGNIVDIGMAIYEHDLIVSAMSCEVGNGESQQWYSLDLVLLKFSTGEFHPLARQPRIRIQRSLEDKPWIFIRIAGDNLALIVHSENERITDKLFIFDWKTGYKRLEHETRENPYSSLVFVSPELLLVPNLILFHFEVWHLPPSYSDSKPPRQVLSLRIPVVSPEYFIIKLECNGEPSPFLHPLLYLPPRPFFTSMETSIIIANLCFEDQPSFTFVAHRQALLDTIQKWTSPSRVGQSSLKWLTNEATVHRDVDLDDGSVRNNAQSKLVSMISHPRFSSPTSSSTTALISPSEVYTSSEPDPSSVPSGSSTSSTTNRYDFLQVQWADWGPPISRWFKSDELQPWYSRTMTGQRCAFLYPNPRDWTKRVLSVVDFNPYNVRKNAKGLMIREGEGEDNSGNSNEEELEMLDHGGAFSEDVYMGLKCVVHHAPDEYDFDVVLMDEERLLGLKGDQRDSIKVLYFG